MGRNDFFDIEEKIRNAEAADKLEEISEQIIEENL